MFHTQLHWNCLLNLVNDYNFSDDPGNVYGYICRHTFDQILNSTTNMQSLITIRNIP